MPHPLQSPLPQVVRLMRAYKDGLKEMDSALMRDMASQWYALEERIEPQIAALSHGVRDMYDRGETPTPSQLFRLGRAQQLRRQMREETNRFLDGADGTIQSFQRRVARRGRDQAIAATLNEHFEAWDIGGGLEGWKGLAPPKGTPEAHKEVWPEANKAAEHGRFRAKAMLRLPDGSGPSPFIELYERNLETGGWDWVANAKGDTNKEALQQANAHLHRRPGGLITDFTRLPVEATEYMVGATGAGTPLRQLLDARLDSDEATIEAINTLRSGTAQGKNPRTVAREMLQSTEGQLQSALTVARTEGLRPYREASRRTYQESGVVTVHKRVATHDMRVCAACIAAEGQKLPVTRTLYDHPNGRCTSIPVVDGLPEVQWEQGPEWLEKQGAETQRAILGRDRFEAWQDGAFEIGDLARHTNDAVWGGSLSVRSLSDFGIEVPTQLVGAKTKDWPDNIGDLEEVQGLGGTTGAKLMQDPRTGEQYVLKRGASPEHIRDEYQANELYRSMGANVPGAQLYEDEDGPAQLMEYVPDARPLGELSGKERRQAQRRLRQDFGSDALLGNWDVTGQDGDNILVDANGKPWRIDNGGALGFRARGGRKSRYPRSIGGWNEFPDELWTMRDTPMRRGPASEYFGSMDWYEVRDSMRSAVENRHSILATIDDDEMRATVERRLWHMEDLVGLTDRMEPEGWTAGHVDEMSRHIMSMRRGGIVDALPDRLRRRDVTVLDDEGREWDNLRGEGSVMEALDDYMRSEGGRMQYVWDWGKCQKFSSWNERSQALKVRFMRKGAYGPDDVYWGPDGLEGATEHYEHHSGCPGWDESFTIWQAFNREALRTMDFEGNNPEKGTIRLIRTEGAKVLQRYGIDEPGRGYTMKRGGNESASVFRSVSVYGGHVTVQEVPHHRVTGMYMFGDRRGNTLFYGEGENEVTFIPAGVEFDYLGKGAGSLDINQILDWSEREYGWRPRGGE